MLVAKLELEQAVESVPPNVGSCCSREGALDYVGLVGAVARLEKDGLGPLVSKVYDSGLAGTSSTMDHNVWRWWRCCLLGSCLDQVLAVGDDDVQYPPLLCIQLP